MYLVVPQLGGPSRGSPVRPRTSPKPCHSTWVRHMAQQCPVTDLPGVSLKSSFDTSAHAEPALADWFNDPKVHRLPFVAVDCFKR